MKKYLLALAMFMATPVSADAVDNIIESTCGEIEEVTYAAYINSQEGVPLSTTLVRLSTIYRDQETMYKLASVFIGSVYELPSPPVSMSVVDAAKTASTASKTVCVSMLQETKEGLVSETEESPKVSM